MIEQTMSRVKILFKHVNIFAIKLDAGHIIKILNEIITFLLGWGLVPPPPPPAPRARGAQRKKRKFFIGFILLISRVAHPSSKTLFPLYFN